jgi:hypothetical protein
MEMVLKNRHFYRIMQQKRLAAESWEHINSTVERAVEDYSKLGVPQKHFDGVELISKPNLGTSRMGGLLFGKTLNIAGTHRSVDFTKNGQIFPFYRFDGIEIWQTPINRYVLERTKEESSEHNGKKRRDELKSVESFRLEFEDIIYHELAHHVFEMNRGKYKSVKRPVGLVFIEAFPSFAAKVLTINNEYEKNNVLRERNREQLGIYTSILRRLSRVPLALANERSTANILGYVLGDAAAAGVSRYKREDQLDILKKMIRSPDAKEDIRTLVKLAEKTDLIDSRSMHFFNYYLRYTDITFSKEKYVTPWFLFLMLKAIDLTTTEPK